MPFPTQLLRNFSDEPKVKIERVQTGVRIEKRMLKVLKALAEYEELTLGELLEDMILHALDGVSTFDMAESRQRIARAQKGLWHGLRCSRGAEFRRGIANEVSLHPQVLRPGLTMMEEGRTPCPPTSAGRRVG